NPEVSDDRLPRLEKNVLRLEVPVNDAGLVRVTECVRDGDGDPHRLVDAKLLLALESRAKGLALHVRHDVVKQPIRLTRIKQREKVRVLQVGRDADLAQEPLGTEHCPELGIEHFERDVALVLEVAGEEYGRHAAAPELTLEGVAAGQGCR